ncbi:MAG TPA: hypothetical protein P5102_08830 [Candidatus Competibacteraceae bacterium]|nr:hypothetical protein [Candidatus Competibacteraceae bacterium]HRZ06243.1 hypothetical protein [Candidatus Competibacteraceae bacterium]HSA47651.1 hypothetical protein [Candidatus Competibacteraceae bacterium]
MNMHLHRKQIVILVLAIALAAASYWIPLPRQTDTQSSRLSGPIDQATPAEAITYVREPAAVWRFPVTVQVPQTPVQTAVQQSAEEVHPVPSLSGGRWISPQDFTDGARSTTYPPLAPVKGLDFSGR